MNEETVLPPEVHQLKGLPLHEAMKDMTKFVSNYLKNGGTIKELEEKGYKFGTVDLNDIAMETQTVIATDEVSEHKGIALFKKAQAKKKFVTEHLAKGGTVEELRQMGFKFGTLDLHNLISKRS